MRSYRCRRCPGGVGSTTSPSHGYGSACATAAPRASGERHGHSEGRPLTECMREARGKGAAATKFAGGAGQRAVLSGGKWEGTTAVCVRQNPPAQADVTVQNKCKIDENGNEGEYCGSVGRESARTKIGGSTENGRYDPDECRHVSDCHSLSRSSLITSINHSLSPGMRREVSAAVKREELWNHSMAPLQPQPISGNGESP